MNNKNQKKRRASNLSPFAFICGMVAIFYVIYRILILAFPVVALGERLVHPQHDDSIVCGQEEGNTLQDPTVILSPSYQKRIEQQSILSPNLVANADLTHLNPTTNEPIGYSHNIDTATSIYQPMQDSDGTRFLRITNGNTSSTSSITPTWLVNPVTITPERTYAYSFWHRSNTPVQITAVYTTSTNSVPSYSSVTTLKATSTWQLFTSHFDNTDQAIALRITVTGTTPGFVDTRSYDVHQIADGELKKGIVSVTFDDGWQSNIDSAQVVLDKYHIRTTQYIISEVADQNVIRYMDIGSIAHLKATGNETGSHSLTHCNQTLLSQAAIVDNAKRSKQILEQNKLGPVETFAYPLGQYNDATQAIFTKFYPLIRTSDSGFNDRYFDETDIHSMCILSSTTTKQFQSWIDYAKTHHLWIVLVYHKVDAQGDYTITSQQLDQQLSIVAKSGLDILPLGEAASSIRK